MKYAAYCGTKNIYPDMEMSAKSLAMNSDVDKIFFIGEGDFPKDLPDYVECIDVSDQKFFKSGGPNMTSQFTYMAMMRAALCHVLPVDKVLSLDADTVCLKDASAVWDIDISDAYFSASIENHRSFGGLIYTNAGVTLFNLAKLRDGKADEVIDVLNRQRFSWVEQDAMNYLCQGRIVPMLGDYNANDWVDYYDPIILHFAGTNDWRGHPAAQKYRAMSWSEVRK